MSLRRRYQVVAILERDITGKVLNEVVGDTAHTFWTRWSARRHARSMQRQRHIIPLTYEVREVTS